jgi:hypothetical protein
MVYLVERSRHSYALAWQRASHCIVEITTFCRISLSPASMVEISSRHPSTMHVYVPAVVLEHEGQANRVREK